MAEPDFRVAVMEARDEIVARLRGRILHAAPSALETLQELAGHAQAETVRLGAARELVGLALDRRRRFDQVEPAELRRVVTALVDAAARRLPDDEFAAFIAEIHAMAGTR